MDTDLWNTLPNSIRSIQSLNVFKKNTTHLLKEALYYLYFIFEAIVLDKTKEKKEPNQTTLPLIFIIPYVVK